MNDLISIHVNSDSLFSDLTIKAYRETKGGGNVALIHIEKAIIAPYVIARNCSDQGTWAYGRYFSNLLDAQKRFHLDALEDLE